MTMSNVDKAYTKFRPQRCAPATRRAIKAIESRTHVAFPGHYREYLLEFNGASFSPPGPVIDASSEEYPPPCLECMYAIGATHPMWELEDIDRLSLWEGNDPPILYPIGRTEAGFFVVLITEAAEDYGCIYLRTYYSPVFKTEHKSHYLASDIEEFFGLLVDPKRFNY